MSKYKPPSAAAKKKQNKEWDSKTTAEVLKILRSRCLATEGSAAALKERARSSTSDDFPCPFPEGNAKYMWKKRQVKFQSGITEAWVLHTKTVPPRVVALDCGVRGLVPLRYLSNNSMLFLTTMVPCSISRIPMWRS